jgi:hypothetical protein
VVHHILTDGRPEFAKACHLELAKHHITKEEFTTLEKAGQIDLVKAFHQVPNVPEDCQKTAVITPFGLFEYNYMPFGLCNAAQTLQRMQDSIFRDLRCTFVYLDDQWVASRGMDQHMEDLRAVFKRQTWPSTWRSASLRWRSWTSWGIPKAPLVPHHSLAVSR